MTEHQRTFDALPEFDERSRDFPVRAMLPDLRPRSFSWWLRLWLDQGTEGACVGFAWAHEAAAFPAPVPGVETATALRIYRRAKDLDQWPGSDYSGTSIIAGAKTMMELGWLTQYRWAFGLGDVLGALSTLGPVVFGLNWYEGMFEPDDAGYIHPTGPQLGRHAITGIGISTRRRDVELHNSWGVEWGKQGRCRMTWDELELLLGQDGEACVPVIR